MRSYFHPQVFGGTLLCLGSVDVSANCRGCGSVLDPTEEQVNQAVDEVLESSLQDAAKRGGVCPLCGHSKEVPVSHRKSVLFVLLVVAVALASTTVYRQHSARQTERANAARAAMEVLKGNANAIALLGPPVTALEKNVTGEITQDETGWHEAKLAVPVQGKDARGVLRLIGSHGDGKWSFTTLEVEVPALHKRANVLTGVIVDYVPEDAMRIHAASAGVADAIQYSSAAPSIPTDVPCVFAVAGELASVGGCSTPVPFSAKSPVDRFEVDLRTGKFIMRQTDLSIASADVYLTRTYTPQDWLSRSQDHAFGMHSNHPYDIAPLGKTNPYTEMEIELEDGSWLYMPRISSGTGYRDAVYEHTETDSTFYQAIMKWAGDGWDLKLKDGASMYFPDSYKARTLSEGAPFRMMNSRGQKIELVRDPQRHLLEIRTPEHWIRFDYDKNWHIVRAEDDSHNWSRYEYSRGGMLTHVENSSGTQRTYSYDGELLTSVADEHGRVLLRNWYDGNWIVRQQYLDGGLWTYEYQYDDAGKRFFANRVVVTGPNGYRRIIPTSHTVSALLRNNK